MIPTLSSDSHLDPACRTFYREAIGILERSGLPYMVGGAYAFEHYTGIARHTKDLDIFIKREDTSAVLRALEAAGLQTELTFSHWLGKAFCNDMFVDVIFSAGNGVAVVDDRWLQYAVDACVFGRQVKLVPAEEMIWSKAFVAERERFDGADVVHILHARAEELDWVRLLERFGEHWRVLLSHIVFFGFVYPGERTRVPAWVVSELIARLEPELETPATEDEARLCRGTLLSRAQYLVDVQQRGYKDARLSPYGRMSREDVARWTAGISVDGEP